MLPPLLLLFPLLLIRLRVAKVPKVSLAELELVLLSLELLGANALAKAKVARVLLPPEPPERDPDPERPPFTARRVAAGELPKELITTASVLDIPLLLSIATAANGLI